MRESAPGRASSSNTSSDKDSSVECPTCGRTDFKNELGMKRHHSYAHGESLFYKETTCAGCGGTTEVRADHYEEFENHYCGDDCMKDRVSVECHGCGAGLERTRKRYENSERFYCSNKCERKRVTLECDTCGGEFDRRPCEVGSTHVYCSTPCRLQGNYQLSGEDNPLYKGGWVDYGSDWKRQRDKARERDGYTCQGCGVPESELPKQLSVHHIIPRRKFNDTDRADQLENLVSLCNQCHKKWEGLPVAPRLLTAE